MNRFRYTYTKYAKLYVYRTRAPSRDVELDAALQYKITLKQ